MRKIYLLIVSLLLSVTAFFGQTTVTINCTGNAGSFNSGYVTDGGTKTDGNLIVSGVTAPLRRGWASFDLSSIPAGSTVNSVSLRFTVTSNNAVSGVTNGIYGFNGTPISIPGGTLYNNCAAGANFNNATWTQNTLNTLAFNAAGLTYITSVLGNSCNIGLVRGAGTSIFNINGYTPATRPQLVITYTPPAYRAQFISMNTGASTWCPGETRNVTVTVKNVGTSTWTDAGPDVNIGVKWNTNGTSWDDYYVRTDAGNLAPGATGTFTLPITASNATSGPTYGTPLAAGTNNLIFDVVKEGDCWFGGNGGLCGPGNSAYTSPNQTINALPSAISVSGGGTHCGTTTLTTTGGTGGTMYFQGTTPNGTSTATPATSQNISTSGTYYFRAFNSCGWGPEGSATVTINTVPTTTVVVGGGTFCGSTLISADNGGDGTMYFQGTISNGTSTATISSSQTITTSGTYYFRARSASGCWGAQGSAIVVINNVPSPVVVSGGGTHCGTTTLAATGGTGGTVYYQGTVSGGTSTSNASTSQVITTSGTYYFRSRSASGCWGPEGSTTVTIIPLPATTVVSGGGTFCGSTTISAVNGADGTMYFQGTTSNGTSTTTPSTSQVISASGTYYFRAQSALGCWGPQGSAVVTINAIPAAVTVSGAGTFCNNTTITASGGTGGTIYFQGTTSGGTSTTTASSSQVVLASGTYYFRSRSTAGCWGSEGSVTVTINPLPATTTVSGAGTFCGSTTLTAANGAGGTMYFQGTTSNGTLTTTPSTSQVISASGTYYFRAQSALGCWGPQGSAVVTINAIPAAVTASGAGTFCNNTTITASGGTGGTIYFQGTTSGGTSTTTASSSQVVLASGTYYFRSRSAAGCWGSEGSVTVTINPLPATTTVSGAGTFCGSTTLTAANGADGTMYFQGTTSNGTSTATPSTSQVVSATGTYYFRAQSALGCWGPQGSAAVIINPLPTGTLTHTETSGTANNDYTICAGAPVTFTATAGYNSYIFKLNGTTVLQTGTSPVYTTSSLANGASITVDVANGFNCGATFGPEVITVNPLPAAILTPDKTTICAGENLVFTASTPGTNYSFKVMGSTVQSGSSHVFQSTTINNNEVVTVEVTNSNGCVALSAPITITVNALPAGTLGASATNICAGTNVVFTALPAGLSTYEFKVNGSTVQGPAASNVFNSSILATPSVVTVIARNTAGCSSTFNSVVVNVNAMPSGTITITENSGTANDNTICSGANVTFTFPPNFKNYNFKIGGISQQSGTANSYTTSGLQSGNSVTVEVTTNDDCVATFTATSVTIAPSPIVTLTPSPAAICLGSSITYTATAGFTNYNFMVGGIQVQNGVSNIFTSTSLVQGNVVSVEVTNSNSCTTLVTAPALNVYALPSSTMVPVETAGITPNDGIICTSAQVIFTVPNIFNNYNFIRNGVSVQNGSSNTYTTSTLVQGDKLEVAVTNANNCIALLNTIIVTVNPLPAIDAIGGNLPVCVNNTITLTNTTTGGTWSSSNTSVATINAGGLVTGISAGTATVSYTVTNSITGCATTVTGLVTVNPLPVVAAIAGNTSICVGSNSTLTNATGSGSWSSNNLAVATVAANGNVSALSSGIAIISYTVTNASTGCSTVVTTTVTVNPLPVVAAITFTGAGTPFQVCEGKTITLASTTTGGVWNSSDKQVATIDPVTGVVTGVKARAIPTTTITYTVTNANGCVTTVSQVVTVNPLPTPTIAGKNPICLNDIETYTTEPGQANYIWVVTGGTINSGGGTNDHQVNITWTSTGTKSISVNYTNSFGCTAATSSNFVNAPTTAPPTFTTGVNAACLNSTGNNYTTQTGKSDYTWTVAGGTITAGGGLSDAGVTITWNTTPGAKTVSVNYSDAFGCNAATPTVYAVTVKPLPTATITVNNIAVCQNGTSPVVRFTGATGPSPYTFIYTINGGLPQTIVSDDAFVTLAHPTLTPGTFVYQLVSVQDGTSCLQAQNGSITITVNPLPVVTITNPLAVCSPSTINLTNGLITAGSTGGLTYSYWTNAAGTTPLANPTAVGAGTYYIKGTTASGCIDIKPVIVTVNTSPTVVTNNPTAVCFPGTIDLTASAVTAGSTASLTYTYFTDAAGTQVYPTPANAVNGTYYIKGETAQGCTDIKAVQVTVHPLPVVVITQPAAVCSPATVDITAAAITAGSTAGLTYTYWTNAAATSPLINPSAAVNGTYYIKGTAATGCVDIKSVTVTVNATPTVVTNNPAAVCSPSTVNLTLPAVTAGSTIGLAFTYFTDAATTNTYSTPTAATAGTYYIRGSILGCSAVQAVTVTVNPLPTATISGTAAVCQNDPVAPLITFTGSNGTAPYTFTYSVNGGANQTVTTISGNSITVAQPTATVSTYNYSLVSVRDASTTLCTQTQNGNAVITVNAPPPAYLVTPSSATICRGDVLPLTAGSAAGTSGTLSFSNTTTIGIPNNGNTTSTINVSGIPANAVIDNIRVNFQVQHDYISELILNLRAPNGNVLNLVNQRGGSGDNFNTTISSSSTNPLNNGAGSAPFNGTYRADAANNVGAPSASNVVAFNALYGTPNGNWVLNLRDIIACRSSFFGFCTGGNYSGNLDSWTISIDYTVPTAPLAVTWSPQQDLYTDPAGTVAYTGQNLSTVYTRPSTPGNKNYTATASNASGCSTTSTVALTVNPTPLVTITADYCIVPGKVRLTATAVPSTVSYIWSTNETTQSIDVDIAGQYDVTVLSGTCVGTATITVANELVINGDFEAGATGFSTQYTGPVGLYNGSAASGLYPEGTYVVDNSANSPSNGVGYHPSFFGRDHTTGTGKFLMLNGSTSLVGPAPGAPRTIWEQNVTVLPNTNYYFSAWAMNLNPADPARLQFEVNGVPVGTIANLNTAPTPTSAGQVGLSNWVRFYSNPYWTSGPTTTSATIRIVNLNTSGGGNDFGLDDISFGTLSTFIRLQSAPGTDGQTVCRNSPITDIVYNVGNGSLTAPTVSPALPAGLTGTFAGDIFTITGTPTVAGGIYNYTITTTGCNPTSASGSITVEAPTIVLSSGSNNTTVCKDQPLTVSYTIGGTATGATVTTLPAGVTALLTGTTYTISGTPTTPGSYPYTITTIGSCNQVTVNGTITVTTPTITLTSGSTNQTVCITSQAIGNIQYTIGGTATGATVSNLPAGVTGTFNSGIMIISGTPTQAGTFTYTVTTTGSSCNAVSLQGTINVTPAAALVLSSVAGSDVQTLCNNTPITTITYVVNNATGAAITSGALPAGVTGLFAGGVFTISGTPATGITGTFNYTITTSGGCGSSTASGTLTVQGQTISLTSGSASPSLCVNSPMTSILYTIGGTATGATVSGLPTGVTGTLAGTVLTLAGTPVTPGSYTFTITTAGTCVPAIIGGTITVQPAATGGLLTNIASCNGGNGSLTLSGQAGLIDRWEISINGGSSWTPITNTSITQNFTNITQPTLYRVVVTNGCGPAFSTTALVAIQNYWTGTTSTDWNTGSNWSDGMVPSLSCPDVTIPAGAPFQPLLSNSTATIINLLVAPGATLTVSNASMRIGGVINAAGNFDLSNGKLDLNGSTQQSINGNMFVNNAVKSLLVSNPAGINVVPSTGKLNIYDTIGFGSVNNATIVTGGDLVLKSTATNTARVIDITNNGVNTGNNFNGIVTVERHFPARRAWRLFTAPVSNGGSVFDNWQNNGVNTPGIGTYVSGPGATVSPNPNALGLDWTPLNNSSLKATVNLTDVTNTHMARLSIPAATSSANIPYFIFVRGDRSSANYNFPNANPTTLSSRGNLQTGPQTFNASAIAGGFSLLGNPYAAPVDFDKLTRTNLSRRLWIWDPYINTDQGGYVLVDYVGGFYDMTPPSPGGLNQILQSGQAFFVETANNGASTLVFNEDDKSDSASKNTAFRPQGIDAALRVNLYPASSVNLKYIMDGVKAYFGASYNEKVDFQDAVKGANVKEMLGLVRNGKNLSIEKRPIIHTNDTLYLQLNKTSQRVYSFEFVPTNFDAGLTAFLEDSYTGIKTPLNLLSSSVVEFAINADAKSAAANRFRIVFKPSVVLPVTYKRISAYQRNDLIAVDWTVENEINIARYEVEKSADGTSFAKVNTTKAVGANRTSTDYQWLDANPLPGNNYYRVRAINADGSAQYSSVAVVKVAGINGGIRIYPNPVTDGIIGAEFKNMASGIYSARLLNSQGQLVLSKTINHAAGTSMETIKPDYKLTAGIYQLEVTAPDKTTIMVKVIIK